MGVAQEQCPPLPVPAAGGLFGQGGGGGGSGAGGVGGDGWALVLEF